MRTTPLRTMTRTQLVAALRTMQAERDRAIARAAYWRDRHAAGCDWNVCECPCHRDLEPVEQGRLQ